MSSSGHKRRAGTPRSRRWSEVENAKLYECVAVAEADGDGEHISVETWDSIATAFENRSGASARARWMYLVKKGRTPSRAEMKRLARESAREWIQDEEGDEEVEDEVEDEVEEEEPEEEEDEEPEQEDDSDESEEEEEEEDNLPVPHTPVRTSKKTDPSPPTRWSKRQAKSAKVRLRESKIRMKALADQVQVLVKQSGGKMSRRLARLFYKLRDPQSPLTQEEEVQLAGELQKLLQRHLSKKDELETQEQKNKRNVAAVGEGYVAPVLDLPPSVDLSRSESFNLAELASRRETFEQLEHIIEALPAGVVAQKINDIDTTGGLHGTALGYAVFFRAPNVVRILLQNGARTDLPDRQGNTPVHAAVQRNFFESNVVELMLKYGGIAVLKQENNEGQTPIDLARDNGSLESSGLDQYVPLIEGDAQGGEPGGEPGTPTTSQRAPTMAMTPLPMQQQYPQMQMGFTGMGGMVHPQMANDMQLMLLKTVQELLNTRKEMDEAREAVKEEVKPQASALQKITSYLKLFLVLAISLLGMAMLTLVLLDTRAVAIEEARMHAAQEKESAVGLYDKLCVRANMDNARKVSTYFLAEDADGHILGDKTCEELKTKMRQDPDKLARADSKVMARKFAETFNEFIETLSAKTWAAIIVLSEGVEGVAGYAANILDFLPFRIGKVFRAVFLDG